jgi:hypothetical protein
MADSSLHSVKVFQGIKRARSEKSVALSHYQLIASVLSNNTIKNFLPIIDGKYFHRYFSCTNLALQYTHRFSVIGQRRNIYGTLFIFDITIQIQRTQHGTNGNQQHWQREDNADKIP